MALPISRWRRSTAAPDPCVQASRCSPEVSRRNSASTTRGDRLASRAAAKRTNSGLPPIRRQISAAVSRSSAPTGRPRASARCANNASAASMVSGGTSTTNSSTQPMTSRLVATTINSGTSPSNRAITGPAPPSTCSQLSRTSTACVRPVESTGAKVSTRADQADRAEESAPMIERAI